MRDSIITFENVSKSYPVYHPVTGGYKNFLFHLPKWLKSLKDSKFEALRDISLTVYKGEAFGIIGRNGAGKSTTLALIAGVLRPTRGKICTKGRVSPLLELGAGFHPELTGRENIILNGVLMGLCRSEVMGKLPAIIEFSEIGEFIDQPIRVYSSGMLARLGFAVIAHLDPEILLIDEVLTVGDIDFQKKCVEKMRVFRETGVTIVFVSHSMPDIEKICSRVAWIEDHAIKMLGPAKEVIAHYSKS